MTRQSRRPEDVAVKKVFSFHVRKGRIRVRKLERFIRFMRMTVNEAKAITHHMRDGDLFRMHRQQKPDFVALNAYLVLTNN